MARSSTQKHVDLFLVPTDTVGTLTSFIQLFSEKAKVNPEIRAVIKTAINWLNVQRTVFQLQHSVPSEAESALVSAELKLLSVWFVQHQEMVRHVEFSPAVAVNQISKGGVAQFHKFVGTIEDDFFTELLGEIEVRASQNSAFKAQLAKGEDGVRQLLNNINRLSSNPNFIFNTMDMLGSKAAGQSAARAKSNNDPTTLILVAIFVVGFVIGLTVGGGNNK